jgi:polyhydroxyalkanoate synthesis regulator phasin
VSQSLGLDRDSRVQMEHAMNETMREMVDKGELSEASYKKLVDELGRKKEEAGAPLFEVTYTENVMHLDDDSDLNFKTDYNNLAKTKIVRGVMKHPTAYRDLAILFHKHHEINLGDDGELCKIYQPGFRMSMMCPDQEQFNGRCMIIYTIIKVRKFNKKRKSQADPNDSD